MPVWHSNKNCERTAPRHLFGLNKKKTKHKCSFTLTRIWNFFHIQCPTVFVTCLHLPEHGRTSIGNNHGTRDSNDLRLQPFARCSSLLNLARITLPTNTCSPTQRSGGTNFILSQKSRRMSSRCWTSRCVFIANFLTLLIEKVLFGWCGCQLFWVHGSWVHEIFWSPSHG